MRQFVTNHVFFNVILLLFQSILESDL